MGHASLSKATSRQIRKAFGPEALEVIAEQQSNLEALKENTESLRSVVVRHQQALENATRRTQFAVKLANLGFFGRLRWFFTGVIPLIFMCLLLSPALAEAIDRTVCPSGCDHTQIQEAVDVANAGDRIILFPGVTYTGVVTFPAKNNITVTTIGELPDRSGTVRNVPSGIGRWLQPADAASLATVQSGTGEAPFVFSPGATNWLIDGINFLPNTAGTGEIIQVNGASGITFKRLIFMVPTSGSQKRFIQGNGTNITLTQSYCSGVWSAGLQDSQCFVAWDGAGPYTITDNYLEAASENVMFGGADPTSAANVPADIVVEYNYFTKPEAWRTQNKAVKNIFELKAAKRVTVRYNLFEKCWGNAQTGTAIMITPANQLGSAPYVVVSDVLFEGNVVRDTWMGFSIIGYGYGSGGTGSTLQTTNIIFRNNFWETNGQGSFGRLGAIGQEVGTLTFDHETYVYTGADATGVKMIELLAEGDIWPTGGPQRAPVYAVQTLTFTNNMLHANDDGLRTSSGNGSAGLTAFVGNGTAGWQNNVLGKLVATGTYPATTTLITMPQLLAELDTANSYRLKTASPYKNAGTDGQDIGWLDGSGVLPPLNVPPPPPAANVAPTVALTSPTAGVSVTAPATITISATAADSDGTVARVDFYAGATLIGTDSSSPYAFSWTNVTAGTYTLTARAVDNANAETTSTGVSVVVTTPFAAPYTHEVSFSVNDRQNGVKRVPPRDPTNVEPILVQLAGELGAKETIASVVSINITPYGGSGHVTEITVKRTVQPTSVTLWLTDGQSGVDYTIAIKITTTGGRTITRRFQQAVTQSLELSR